MWNDLTFGPDTVRKGKWRKKKSTHKKESNDMEGHVFVLFSQPESTHCLIAETYQELIYTMKQPSPQQRIKEKGTPVTKSTACSIQI